jgi:YbgC/YbaW family acyl-CoA thioester hydrolase
MWSDTDPAAIVWFGVFFRYFENAEEELFRRLGRDRTPLLHELGIFMPRTSLQAQFRSPAKLGDEILVGVGVGEITDRRVRYAFDIRERGTRRLICEASYRVACVDAKTFTPRAFPHEITNLLSRAMPSGTRAGAPAEHSREAGARRRSRASNPAREVRATEASHSVDSGARRRHK